MEMHKTLQSMLDDTARQRRLYRKQMRKLEDLEYRLGSDVRGVVEKYFKPKKETNLKGNLTKLNEVISNHLNENMKYTDVPQAKTIIDDMNSKLQDKGISTRLSLNYKRKIIPHYNVTSENLVHEDA